jgi:hypothetical protein
LTHAEFAASESAADRTHREIGRLIESIAGRVRKFDISTPDESDSFTGGRHDYFWITLWHWKGGYTSECRRTLLEVLQSVTNEEPTFACTRCGQQKLASEFPRDASRPTGRFPHCHVCNRENVRQRKLARRLRQLARMTFPCTKCGVRKTQAEFPKDASRASGRFPHCHECNRENVKRRAEERKKRKQKKNEPDSDLRPLRQRPRTAGAGPRLAGSVPVLGGCG